MNLVEIVYQLDEHELPDHCFVSGDLEIELDEVDGEPYIWAFQLKVYNSATDITVEHFYSRGGNNWQPSVDLKNELHRDKQLMSRIWDECARQGAWAE